MKIFIPRFLINLLSIFILPTRFYGLKNLIYRLGGVSIGSGVRITSECKIFGNGYISIGANTWIGMGADLFIPEGGVLNIGENCDIAPRVTFLCGTHKIGSSFQRAGIGMVEEINIGSGVWIGARSTILPGVNLNDGIVVAAGSVILRGDYPENVLLGGNPAKILRHL
jgi:maltose O-acetyltransferase